MGDADDMVEVVDGRLKRGEEGSLVDLLKLAKLKIKHQSATWDHVKHKAGNKASSYAATVISDNVGVLRVL